MIILESPLVSYVIEDLLGKNLTLTNRTLIWGMVVDGFLNSPIIGTVLEKLRVYSIYLSNIRKVI